MDTWHEYHKELENICQTLPEAPETQLGGLLQRSLNLLASLEHESGDENVSHEQLAGVGAKADLVWDFLLDYDIVLPKDADEQLRSLVQRWRAEPLTVELENSLKNDLQEYQETVRRDFNRADELQLEVEDRRKTLEVLRAYLNLLDALNPPPD